MENYEGFEQDTTGHVLMWILKFGVLAVTAVLNLLLVQTFLPAGITQFVAFGAIGVMEGGVMFWPRAHNKTARHPRQYTVSQIMTWVDIICVTVSAIISALNVSAARDLASKPNQDMETGIIVFVITVLALNIIGFVQMEMWDPETMHRRNQQKIGYIKMRAEAMGRQDAAQHSFQPLAAAALRKEIQLTAAQHGYELPQGQSMDIPYFAKVQRPQRNENSVVAVPVDTSKPSFFQRLKNQRRQSPAYPNAYNHTDDEILAATSERPMPVEAKSSGIPIGDNEEWEWDHGKRFPKVPRDYTDDDGVPWRFAGYNGLQQMYVPPNTMLMGELPPDERAEVLREANKGVFDPPKQ